MNSNARQNYRGNRFRGNFRGYCRHNVEKITGTKGVVTTIEIGIGQGKESLQEAMGETEAVAMTGPDQGPEVVQIGIG